MNFEELEKLVYRWAQERYIFSEEHGSSASKQCKKLYEEFWEMKEAVDRNDLPEILDGLGDMLVVMIIIASFKHMTLTAALAEAYDQIKDRKGRMVDGIFVKEQ